MISYPGDASEKEKRELLDSCKIAEVPLFRMVSEPFAVSRAGNFKNTLFVDFGYRKLSLYVIDGVEIGRQKHCSDLGVRDIDAFMFEQYCEMFAQSSGGVGVKGNRKAEMRLVEGIEKQRKELSSNKEASLVLESLVKEFDLEHSLKREEYEDMIGNELNRI